MTISHSHTSQHWTHLPRCEFIQLAMIGAQEIRRGGPEEEMIRLAQQGKIETILSQKEPIELHNLFPLPARPPPLVVLPPPLPGRVCLIEGAPGGGKSTLALHICHQWALGASWLAKFDLVVLAYLRDEAVQNANTLADILPAKESSSQLIIPQLQASCGDNVLFVFDGWDEFPLHLMNDSLVSTIIHLPYKLSLHQSTVLITSRPVSSGNLLHIADHRIEILGFTQHQIREYISKALDGNSTEIQKLVEHLDDHPVIEGYCYIPLHSAILVHIFLTMKGALPTTRHELFCSLVLCCIIREQVTHKPDKPLPELSSLDDLPDDLKTKLSKLCVLAYNGVMQNKIVFYSKDLMSSHVPITLSSLGLLQAVEGLSLYKNSISYNFLHLSVQELLAAYYISQLVPSEQVKVFQEWFESSRFQAVLNYYCGFTKLDNPEIQTFISSLQTRSFEDLLPLLHCFFEAQQPSLCQLVDPRLIPNKLNSTHLTPVDFLVVGYLITSLLSTSTANTPTMHLVVDGIDDHRLKMLLTELSKCPVGGIPTSAGAVSLRLESCNPSVTEQGLSCIKKSLSAISELVLYNGIIHRDEDVLLPIAEAMQTNTYLTKLRLPNMRLHHTKQNSSALTKMLQVNKSLTQLDLSRNIQISDSGARCMFEGLQHNTTLVSLNLCHTGMTATDPDTARFLTKMLQVNKSLTHLNLSRNKFSDLGARCIFDGLQHNTTLVYLNLSSAGKHITNPDTAMSLTKMLKGNKTLEHLDLSNDLILSFRTISHGMISCIFEGLEHNTTLRKLNLQRASDITDTDTEHIARVLKSNHSLEILNIAMFVS